MINKDIINIFLLTTLLIIFYFILSVFQFAQAAPNDSLPNWTMPDLQIDIGGLKDKLKTSRPVECGVDEQGNKKVCISWIGQYIAGVYQYAIGIVGILAAVVLMFGGIIWLTAGGSATQIGNAKAWIGASLTGLVIALCSYMILYLINPDLTIFKPLRIQLAKKTDTPTITSKCEWQDPPETYGTGVSLNPCDPAESGGWTTGTDCNESQKQPNQICCCQVFGSKSMCKSNAPAPNFCAACNNCVNSTINCKENPCLVNKDLETKLESMNVSFAWRITEPWPPTVHHDSTCHKDGTCVDISIILTTDDTTNLLRNSLLKAAAAEKGLHVLDEYDGNIISNNWTGRHLHISL